MKHIQEFTVLQRVSFILCICLFFSFGDQKAFSQIDSVYVGDTVISRSIDGPQPPQGSTCYPNIIEITHHIGADFYLDGFLPPGYYYGGFLCNAMFAPQRIGLQLDTFYITTSWAFNRGTDCGPEWHGGPFLAKGVGISDSVILFRTSYYYDLVKYTYHLINFVWNVGSNKYFAMYDPPDFIGYTMPIELVNNVEASTNFEFSIAIDPGSSVHPMISIEGDSSSFPKSYTFPPKTRRKKGFIYFFTDSKGFDKDTSFNAVVKVIIHNPSYNDTTNVNYQLIFRAKPVVAVHSIQEKSIESIAITSSPDGQRIIISSVFSQPQNPTLELFDALGRQLPLPTSQLQIPSGTSSQKLEVGNLRSGCYILRMKMKDQVISKSFIIAR